MKPSKQPVGLACLRDKFMFAHDFYKGLGDCYFTVASKGSTGILPAVKKCYTIAAINLKLMIDVCKEADRKN
jgi:hypothetical protein